MTPDDRKALAEQLLSNPLFPVLMDEMEQGAVDSLIAAGTDTGRMERQARVRAIRSFRADCEAELRNNRPRKGAPA